MRITGKRSLLSAAIVLILVLAASSAQAEDERFAIRFGLVVLDPTSDSEFMGQTNALDTAYGAGFEFEWYFAPRLGLVGSIATVADANVQEDDETVAGIALTPITIGINLHLVRTPKIDWSIGAMAGQMYYGDFEFDDNSGTFDVDNESIYGVRTGVDFGVTQSGRWGVGVDLEYLSADLTTLGAIPREIDVDPLLARVTGVFRW